MLPVYKIKVDQLAISSQICDIFAARSLTAGAWHPGDEDAFTSSRA